MPDEDNRVPQADAAYRLELTPAQLKVTHTALKCFFDGLGHEERGVQIVVVEVLSKLPPDDEVRAIDLGDELARRRAARAAPVASSGAS
jgi:hypothetical protein